MSENVTKIVVETERKGDGLTKAKTEVDSLSRATSDALPILDSTKTREEQVAAVRLRHAEAAREAAAAEEELSAKREAAFAKLDAMKAEDGGEDQAGKGGMGKAVGLGLAGGMAAARIIGEITAQLDAERIATQQQTFELEKQIAAWAGIVTRADSMADVLKLHESIYTRLDGMREKLAEIPMTGAGIGGFSTQWVDGLKLIDRALDHHFNNGAGEAERFQTSWEQAETHARQALRVEETFAKALARQAEERASHREKIAALPVDERVRALNDELMTLQATQSGMEKWGKNWREAQHEIEAMNKRIAEAVKEQERLTVAREREGQQLDANMRKEGEKFALGEAAREREGQQLDANMRKEGEKFAQSEAAREREGRQLDANMRKEAEIFAKREKADQDEARRKGKEGEDAVRKLREDVAKRNMENGVAPVLPKISGDPNSGELTTGGLKTGGLKTGGLKTGGLKSGGGTSFDDFFHPPSGARTSFDDFFHPKPKSDLPSGVSPARAHDDISGTMPAGVSPARAHDDTSGSAMENVTDLRRQSDRAGASLREAAQSVAALLLENIKNQNAAALTLSNVVSRENVHS